MRKAWQGVAMDGGTAPAASLPARTRHARALFAGISSNYDVVAELLSFGQNGRWRRAMVARVADGLDVASDRTASMNGGPLVLDVATGPAAVARELVGRRPAVSVIGVDQSAQMLGAGARIVDSMGLRGSIRFALAQGERLPFADESFDAVMFTYLLRYVDDPEATLRELSRVVRTGGTLANLEFAVPSMPVWRALWMIYTRGVLPVAGRALSPAWGEVGRFLGPSIAGFYRSYPPRSQLAMWRRVGISDVRARPMSLGGGVVIWGSKAGGAGD
jgi:demethylmenaquinone methyltransferase / 2-methoxy-6-polyprenyl-1,4-benzoquinol methylase